LVFILRVINGDKETLVGSAYNIKAEVSLGRLSPEEVTVQIYSGPLNADNIIQDSEVDEMKCTSRLSNGNFQYEGFIPCDESGLYGYSIRVLPSHPDMTDNFGFELMRWIGDLVFTQSYRELAEAHTI
jgi:starch phosphorylase